MRLSTYVIAGLFSSFQLNAASANVSTPSSLEHGVAVGACDANAGVLVPITMDPCTSGGPVNIIANWSGQVVPPGFQAIFLLTRGAEQTIYAGAFTPSFNVSLVAEHTMHSLIYDNNLDLGTVQFGVSVLQDLNVMLIQGGGTVCGSLDMVGATFNVTECATTCDAMAGSMIADEPQVCLVEGLATISGTVDGNAELPEGYTLVYTLSYGSNHVLVDGSDTPEFEVATTGLYRIHPVVLDTLTFDLATVVFGETTFADLHDQFIQGGGSICASADPTGASVVVLDCELPCEAEAGTLSANGPVGCFSGAAVDVSASPNGDAVVPSGFSVLYLLTIGEGQVITSASFSPTFQLTAPGLYTIHTLVYDPNTLDLEQFNFGVSTADDVDALLIQGGGLICGSVDLIGAVIELTPCCPADAGTLTVNELIGCFDGAPIQASATANGDAIVPDDFQVIYLISSGENQVIIGASLTPSYEAMAPGLYTIHTLVFDPSTLDLDQFTFGESTAADVVALLFQGGGSICASMDLTGAVVNVASCCEAGAGTLTPNEPVGCFAGDPIEVAATANGDAVVPDGFQVLYLITIGENQVITGAALTPIYEAQAPGLYTIHTLVYDPNTLDLDQFTFGISTAEDVAALLIQGEGSICGSLDLIGATTNVAICCEANAGTLSADTATLCFIAGATSIAAALNGDAVVPVGFEVLYIITTGEELLITGASLTPSYEAPTPGAYTIHTLVYDPNTLDLGLLTFGVSTGGDVDALLIQGGGTICGSLDLVGASTEVLDCVPANDDCTNAIELPINGVDDCSSTGGDNTYATSGVEAEPSCGPSTTGITDVWYVFNSGANTSVSIILDPGTMENWAVSVSDACSGGMEVLCEASPTMPLELTTIPETDYWVRVFSNLDLGAGGTFTLCVTGETPTYVCDGGTVEGSNGATQITICQDSNPDVIDVFTTSTSVEGYMFIATDEAGVIVAPISGNSMDFNSLPLGGYQVWGISFNGMLEGVAPGGNILDVTATGECIELSSGFLSIQVDLCSGLAEIEGEVWGVFPNPARGAFNIQYGGSTTNATIEVVDANGRLVIRDRASFANGQVRTISLGDELATGIYTVRLTSSREVANVRLVVQ